MHILNRLRELVSDKTDTTTSKQQKIDYLKLWCDFLSNNIVNKKTSILTSIDWLVYSIPLDYNLVLSVLESLYKYKLIENIDYTIKTFDKELIIIEKTIGEPELYKKWNLDFTYASKTELHLSKLLDNIVLWENTIIVNDITKYYIWQEVLLSNDTIEELIEITNIDKINNTITFSCLNNFNIWDEIFPNLKTENSNKEIVVYYSAILIDEINNNTNSSKTSWKQGEISYTTENSSWTKSTFEEKLEYLLKSNVNFKDNLENKSKSIRFKRQIIT